MDEARAIVREYARCGGVIGVAVSGGADSMCLLSLVMEQVPPERIAVINVEHGIRGKSSVEDSEFVKRFAAEHGLKLLFRSADVPGRRRESGRSEESEAREVRREFFEELLASGEVDRIFTAHNLGDRTESVMLHMLRGSGLNGLIGMSERDGRYVRPLLGVSRERIEAYDRDRGVPFVVDETNADTRYARNFLRHEILPRLRERFAVDETLALLSANARRDEAFIRSLLRPEYVSGDGGTVRLNIEALRQPEALATRYVLMAAARAGRTTDISAAHVAAAVALKDKPNGKRVDLGGGLVAFREYDAIAFTVPSERTECGETPFAIGLTPFGGGTICVRSASAPQKGRLVVDGDKVPFGAVIRLRRAGDRFKPFGSGTKKLKEFLIDEKVPARIRDNLPLLAYENRVLAVFGMEIADEMKVTAETVNPLELIFTEDE